MVMGEKLTTNTNNCTFLACPIEHTWVTVSTLPDIPVVLELAHSSYAMHLPSCGPATALLPLLPSSLRLIGRSKYRYPATPSNIPCFIIKTFAFAVFGPLSTSADRAVQVQVPGHALLHPVLRELAELDMHPGALMD